ncbi:50S ribosome-binding GTPase [Candidatus Woesearchaeota archaeon]|nr:50S ribosome-binding GTPase [Candidatus Woesearchaeota archaeon]
MPNFWRHVNYVLDNADIIIEVLDARSIDETRHPEIEQKVLLSGKILLYVITKCDLVDITQLKKDRGNLRPSVYISSREHLGTTMLKKKILMLSHGEKCVVGVVGYPNVGKSSLINALAGRGAARTSSESGFTKGLQKIRVDSKILLLDTPGVFPSKEKNDAKHGRTGAVDYAKIKDPELAAMTLIEDEFDLIRRYYEVDGVDAEEILEQIAHRLKRLLKGGQPDLEATSRLILRDWQTGKMAHG